MTTWNRETIESIAEEALNRAIATIQDAIGQTDGGFAALWFTGERETTIKSILSDYARAEINEGWIK